MSEWGAIILSGGRSQRFGAPKVLQSFLGEPFLTRIRKNLTQAGINNIVLVLGHRAEELLPKIPGAEKFTIAINKHYHKGQLSSLQTGLQKMDKDVSGVLMCLVDQPHVTAQTYLKLLTEAEKNPESFLIPSFKRQGGHPVFIPSRFFQEILEIEAEENSLKTVIRAHPQNVHYIDVDDPAILEDIDTRERLRELEEKYRSA